MTNPASGSKRAWEGNDAESHKRPREDPRDWRDVHLDSPRRKAPHSGRRDSHDRRPPHGDYRPHSRERDYSRRQPGDYSRERERDRRDDKDRERERDRPRDRSRGSDRRWDGPRDRRPSPHRTNGTSSSRPPTQVDNEKEEENARGTALGITAVARAGTTPLGETVVVVVTGVGMTHTVDVLHLVETNLRMVHPQSG
ncbi:hypothetical protein L226DRAFT_205579 [Lentinus tigrinus ALCF2SS1-7]|uniref:Uncharacterized protein n=1 Tax=Lentinus tigrinus ALCF2SS1-6 TaxID=1328759 RepID=A0A5C2RUB8_9APHY|nr:hypothetical protein L227DRAFT_307188 [Lentinus tigrinus ALCF2SS1-6]RPD71270.1 hypothetical protein L226DRAFT_205579 [Lentinus tigrinus ALCF2SS1-7]